MRCLRLGGLLGSLMVLAACVDRVGQPMIPVEQARLDHRRIAMHVLAVHRAERIAGPSAGASHLIEVECLGGDGRPNGTRLTLPYDDWNVGAPPPEPGTTVTTSPAAWLQRAPASKGVPREGWDR